jgi:hypothetical protein
VLHLAFEKFDILDGCLALVLTRQREHVIRHIKTVRFAAGAHPASGQQNVNAAARPKVKHGFTRVELRKCRRIAATKRRFA